MANATARVKKDAVRWNDGREFPKVPLETISAETTYYTGAMVGLLAADNTPLGRAVVHSEFQNVRDLFDRISGGTGPGGVKAVAPTGVEPVTIVIPADEPSDSVSIVGLRLIESRIDGSDQFVASGRPIAIVSNVMLEYRPGPPPRTPPRRR